MQTCLNTKRNNSIIFILRGCSFCPSAGTYTSQTGFIYIY